MYQTQQLRAPALVAQVTNPAFPTTVTPTQLDIGNLIGTIMPLFTLMMVFGLLMPMMKQMGETFK